MGTYIFDFNLSAWVQNLEIEADSLDEAREKFRTMSVEDIIDAGYVHNFDVTDLDIDEPEEETYYDDDDDPVWIDSDYENEEDED